MASNQNDWLRAIAVATGAGMTLLCMILIGVYVGHLIDDYCGTAYWGILIGGFVGGAVGIWSIIRQLVHRS